MQATEIPCPVEHPEQSAKEVSVRDPNAIKRKPVDPTSLFRQITPNSQQYEEDEDDGDLEFYGGLLAITALVGAAAYFYFARQQKTGV